MCTPKTREEYEERFAATHRIEGRGIEGVTFHTPCPACAAPDFLVHRLLDVETAWEAGATCEECGRGFRAEIARTNFGGRRFSLVQWRGDPSPAWIAIRYA